MACHVSSANSSCSTSGDRPDRADPSIGAFGGGGLPSTEQVGRSLARGGDLQTLAALALEGLPELQRCVLHHVSEPGGNEKLWIQTSGEERSDSGLVWENVSNLGQPGEGPVR